MSKDTLTKIRQHYLNLRRDIVNSIKTNNVEEIDVQGDDIDQIQGKTLSAIAEHLGHRDLLRLRRLDAALARIEDGSFGHCEECGCLIGERRLMAIPGVECCVQCAEELERQSVAFAS